MNSNSVGAHPFLGIVPAVRHVDLEDAGFGVQPLTWRTPPAAWDALVVQFQRDVVSDRTLDAGQAADFCSALTLGEVDDPAPRVDRAEGLVPGLDADERYSLDAGPGGATIRASHAAGVRHALTCLRQMLSAAVVEGAPGVLEVCHIEDGPRWSWRSLTIDVVRHFVPPDDLVRLIELAALHRLSVLHVHLTDDQGWRLEVPGLPELTRDGDHYTTKQWRDLVRHAETRGVTLVPEVDVPGHCGALLRARPELASPDGAWLDPRRPGALELVDQIYSHLCEIASGRYVHIGGDEVFGMPLDLYSQVVQRARWAVRSMGRRPIGWQESARAGLESEDVLHYWIDVDTNREVVEAALEPELLAAMEESMARSDDDIRRAEEVGAAVVVSPAVHAYLDRPYAELSTEPEQEDDRQRLGMRAYTAAPVTSAHGWSVAGAVGDSARIAGVGAAIWSETIRSVDDLGFLLLPRLASVAEVAWGSGGDWDDHVRGLVVQPRLWEAMGWTSWFRSSVIPWRVEPIFVK